MYGFTGSIALLLSWAVLVILVIVFFIALYWVIRKAVAAGIRDTWTDRSIDVE